MAADDEITGTVAPVACKMLMKDLWLARLSRPEISKAIGDLATHIHKWSRNDDKKLHRLMGYIQFTSHYSLRGFIRDHPSKLKLLLFVDADFAGDVETTRSTSGGLLVLAGPNSWFPIAWMARRQTATARSTTEAEVASLAMALFGEALPMISLWDTILGRPIDLYILEDNQATIKIVNRGYSASSYGAQP